MFRSRFRMLFSAVYTFRLFLEEAKTSLIAHPYFWANSPNSLLNNLEPEKSSTRSIKQSGRVSCTRHDVHANTNTCEM